MTRAEAALEALREGLGSWRFGAFLVVAPLAAGCAMLGLLLLPAPAGPMGAFAEQFRIWCFGYDPATGRIDGVWTAAMVLNPLGLAAIAAWVWREPLGTSLRRPRTLLPSAGLALLFVATGAAAFAWTREPPDPPGPLPFPAAALRTTAPAPDFALEDQDGTRVSRGALRGKVVLVTAIYSSCGSTCPMILAGARHAVASVGEEHRQDVVVVAVTLDPAHDDRANLFLLVDRGGRLAYRFTVGEQQERWLEQAIALLLDEPVPTRK
jgi:cytochrome oxidase Cu insertion factor (SCO1/SenC/PrrC family)